MKPMKPMKQLEDAPLDKEVKERIAYWLSDAFDAQTRKELQQLIEQEDWEELGERFGGFLDFGTGGMRGKMEAGTNRMNSYIVAMATQGLANYVHKVYGRGESLKAVVAYDSRHNSLLFARRTAEVLAGNGFEVLVFEDLRPTPELSFAVIREQAKTGIVITASHNPSPDNGYKVYWVDGAQIIPPHDEGIVSEVVKIHTMEEVKSVNYDDAVMEGKIKLLGKETDRAFIKALRPCSLNPDLVKRHGKELKIVFTPLFGTGIRLIPDALRDWGFKRVIICEEQAEPNGDFPGLKFANPEIPEALEAAERVAEQEGAELVLASDPDCDRIGILARNGEGKLERFTGNQLSSLITYYLLSELKRQGRLPGNGAVVTTIVTTRMIEQICHSFGVEVVYCLTGFKWICSFIRIWEGLREGHPQKRVFLYGTEESYGHLIGTHCRDKDGVVAACVAAELTAWAREQGRTLSDLLAGLYREYGIFIEDQVNEYFEERMDIIEAKMEKLRNGPPRELGGLRVERIADVAEGYVYDPEWGVVEYLSLPRSNVIILHLEGGHQVIARPSGTEPKIKYYFLFQDCQGLPIPEKQLFQRKDKLKTLLQTVRAEFVKVLRI